MSAALVLPWVWGFAEPEIAEPGIAGPRAVEPELVEPELVEPELVELPRPARPQMAFYRKYTEALLRRYLRLSMEAGRVPSLLGKEMFRGNVTSYRMKCFEDAVIFLHDVEHCLERLDPHQQDLVSRIALQEFTVFETADLLQLPARTVIRRYGQALDRLTRIFLRVKMLEPQNCCQGANPVDNATTSPD